MSNNLSISTVVSPDILKTISSSTAIKTFGDQLVNKTKDKVISVVEGKVGELKKGECGFANIDLVIMRKEFQ